MKHPGIRFALLAALAAGAPATAQAAFDPALPIPPVITDPNPVIHAKEADVQILPGTKTRMWTFDGTFPGPTIRRPAGTPTSVTFVNDLPDTTGPLTIHNHGAHVPPADDGQPDQQQIPPGQQKVYTYPLMEGGQPERAAFQWYHDHRLDVTGRNVWNGLAGMFIIDDPVDSSLPLPKDPYDIPLMVLDRHFDANNQLTYPEPVPFGTLGRSYPGTGEPPDDGLLGDKLLVNGAVQPHLDVEPRRYRLRLLNASNARVLTFSLGNGQAMTQIATESGLLPAPVERTSITLGPAERAEVVVDFAADVGSDVVLTTGAGDVMQFRVSATPVTDLSSVPATLRAAPDLGAPERTRTFSLGLVEDPAHVDHTSWGINGLPYDGSRNDAGPRLGSTEIWTFRGGSRVHTVHIHSTDFEVVSRDGVAPPPWEAGLKETVLVQPGETVSVKLRFTDNLGSYVFHCHVLEHEDNGLMARFAVSTDGDAPPPPPDELPPGDPGAPAQSSPPPSGPGLQPPGVAALRLRWTGAPKTLRSRAKLHLEARNTGTATSAPATVGLTAPAALHVKKRFALATLAPGAARTFTIALRGRRLTARTVKLVARVGATSATLSYRRRHGHLVRAARAAAARWICPLAA